MKAGKGEDLPHTGSQLPTILPVNSISFTMHSHDHRTDLLSCDHHTYVTSIMLSKDIHFVLKPFQTV